MLIGCTAHHTPTVKTPALFEQADAGLVTASALSFDPPVISAEPALDLSRENRGAIAVLGYDVPIATFSYVRSDDRYGP